MRLMSEIQSDYEKLIRSSVEAVQRRTPQIITQWALKVESPSVQASGIQTIDYEKAVRDVAFEMRQHDTLKRLGSWLAQEELAYDAMFVDSQVTYSEVNETVINDRVADFVVETVLFRAFVPFRGSYDEQTLCELIERSWKDFVQYLFHFEDITLMWKVYFRGLEPIDAAYEMEPDVWLRPATKVEQAEYYNLAHPLEGLRFTRRWLPPYSFDSFIVPNVVMEGTEACHMPRMGWHEPTYHEKMSRMIFALRLAGPSQADSYLLWIDSDNMFYPEQPQFQHVLQTNSHFGFKPPLKLSDSIVEDLKRFYMGRGIGLDSSAFNQAKRRLLAGTGKPNRADEFLDYWIGLEALFLKGIRQELSFRVSTRIAQYLGANSDERHQLFKLAKNSYDARSKVAHGEEFSPDDDLVEATASLLRRSLGKVVTSGMLPIGDQLDELMIRRTAE